MSKRTPYMQTKHNKKVKEISKKLEREGWNVKADIQGYDDTPLVAGKQPDIFATKSGHTRIYEVETRDSVDQDKDQISTFKRHEGQKPNTSFHLIVVE